MSVLSSVLIKRTRVRLMQTNGVSRLSRIRCGTAAHIVYLDIGIFYFPAGVLRQAFLYPSVMKLLFGMGVEDKLAAGTKPQHTSMEGRTQRWRKTGLKL